MLLLGHAEGAPSSPPLPPPPRHAPEQVQPEPAPSPCRTISANLGLAGVVASQDELLLFKQWDSDPLQPARIGFHTAFTDPTAPPDAPPRESIEVRAYCFFPEHEPNTCPPLPKTPAERAGGGKAVEETAAGAEAVVQKMLAACDHMGGWPAAARPYIKMCLAGGDGGAARMAQSFVNDSTGGFGMQGASEEFKEEVKGKLLAAGFAVSLIAALTYTATCLPFVVMPLR